MKKNILIFILYFLLILLFTNGLFNNFFEQDEWGAFGDIIYSFNLPWWDALISKGIHFSPFGFIYWKIFYILFDFEAKFYIFAQLLLHAVASFLVFKLSAKLSKNFWIGIFSGVLFAINGPGNQAFTHLAIFNTVFAFIFIISFFLYLTEIREKFLTFKNSLILSLLFLCSVFFREEGFIIIPLFFLYLFIFDKEKLNRKNLRHFIFLISTVVALFIFRSVSQMLNTTPIPSNAYFSLKAFFYNIFALPIKLVVQNIIDGNRLFFFLLEKNSVIYRETKIDFQTSYPLLMDLADLIIFNVLVILGLVWLYFKKSKLLLRNIFFAILWILANSAILSLVGRSIYKIEPRYLYFSSFPVFILISFFLISIFFLKSKYHFLNRALKIIVVIVFVVILISSYFDIQKAVDQKSFNGIARRKFLNSILTNYPTIPNNTIFYFECKDVCYRNARDFGIPSENVLPFSSGPGWIILSLYSNNHEKTWGKFLNNAFLLGARTQGYRRIGDYAFGYFVDKKLLKETLEKNKLETNTVIALEYNEEEFSVKDISKNVREELDEN